MNFFVILSGILARIGYLGHTEHLHDSNWHIATQETNMTLRKTAARTNGPKVFAPEGYADFPIVAPAQIAKLKEETAQELSGKTWELSADLI